MSGKFSMTSYVIRGRVHAVVKTRRLRTISQLWSAAIGPSRQHTIRLCREGSRQDKTQALSDTLVKG
jgi:hypothetical protein